MGRGIISIVIGVGMIIGGMSGQLVLRGTESGGGLAIIGFIVIGVGIFRIVKAKSDAPPGGGVPPAGGAPPG